VKLSPHFHNISQTLSQWDADIFLRLYERCQAYLSEYYVNKTRLSFIIVYKPSLKNCKNENFVTIRYNESYAQTRTFVSSNRLIYM